MFWSTHLSPNGVWAADHSTLKDGWMLSKGTLDLNRPNPVAGREKKLPNGFPSPIESRGEERENCLTWKS